MPHASWILMMSSHNGAGTLTNFRNEKEFNFWAGYTFTWLMRHKVCTVYRKWYFSHLCPLSASIQPPPSLLILHCSLSEIISVYSNKIWKYRSEDFLRLLSSLINPCLRTLPLKVWSSEQQHQYHLGVSSKCRINMSKSGPSPDSRIRIGIFTRSPEDLQCLKVWGAVL